PLAPAADLPPLSLTTLFRSRRHAKDVAHPVCRRYERRSLRRHGGASRIEMPVGTDRVANARQWLWMPARVGRLLGTRVVRVDERSAEHTSELQSRGQLGCRL